MTTREQWLNDFATAARPVFADAGHPLPEKIRLSVGFPKGSRKAIGQCWADIASQDGNFEIFVTPAIADSERVADIITHELAHAAVGLAAGHKRPFAKCAKAVGLEGRMTATTAGDVWRAWALPILTQLGPIPHASLDGSVSSGPKKQATRMIKCECGECGFIFRTTRKWLDALQVDDSFFCAPVCPRMGCGERMSCEGMEPEGEEGEGE